MPDWPDMTWFGERALLLEWGDEPGPASTARVQALVRAIEAAALPGVAGLTPGFTSVLVQLATEPAPDFQTTLRGVARSLPASPVLVSRARVIPAIFGGEFGPDLADVAQRTGRSPRAVMDLLVATEQTVLLVGFAPGFPYLGDLPAALSLPRRATPRERVPAGAIAIAGRQTGIYPFESPGGWHLLGRTPRTLFDPRRDPPTYLAPGDRVRFQPIQADEWAAYQGAAVDW